MSLFFWLPLVTTIASNHAQNTPASKPEAAPPATGFLYKTVEFDGDTYAYCAYVPPEYKSDRKWPVILFLHGSGERGADGFLQTEIGIGTAIRRNRALCPAVVVMPQCRPNQMWSDRMADMALKCLEQTSRDYNLDADRIYLTGLSLGGAGTWEIAGRHPERFAAVAPVCGFVGRPDKPADQTHLKELAAKLAKTPIWCWHGGADKNVAPQRTQEAVAALRAAGGSPKYSEVAEAAHNVWDAAYGNAEFWKWLLAQKRK